MVTLCLEEDIPYRKCFIHNENLRIDIDGHCKRKTNKHTAGISFHRLIYILADICKIQNRLQFFIDLFFCEAYHGTVQVYILYAIIFHIEAGAQLQ